MTLGGSDTYGVTIKVAKFLQDLGIDADYVAGPSFQHIDALSQVISDPEKIHVSPKSLIALFHSYDLAITGGGITPFEANASGLPTLTIANEIHEIEIARYLQSLGGSIFLNYYKELRPEDLDFRHIDIQSMSKNGISHIPLNGAENIYKAIARL